MTSTESDNLGVRGLNFYLAVGKQYYQSALGFRLLVVGESRLLENAAKRARHPGVDSMLEVIARAIQTKQLFSRTASLFDKHLHSKAWFWDHVALYNYCEWSTLTGKGHSPAAMLRPSRVTFEFVLRTLQPNAILTLGNATWHRTPDLTYAMPSFMMDNEGNVIEIHNYLLGNADCPMTYIHHPSSHGWTRQRWQPIVDGLCSLAK